MTQSLLARHICNYLNVSHDMLVPTGLCFNFYDFIHFFSSHITFSFVSLPRNFNVICILISLPLENFTSIFWICIAFWGRPFLSIISAASYSNLLTGFGIIFAWLVGFFTSWSATRLFRERVPRLTSDNFTCCHTRDKAWRPWLRSQPVTLYWHRPNQ